MKLTDCHVTWLAIVALDIFVLFFRFCPGSRLQPVKAGGTRLIPDWIEDI